MRWDLIIVLGIFFKAKIELVFLCLTIITVPNLPYPSVLMILNSSSDNLVVFFFKSGISINLLGGDLESELLVEVGDPTCLNLYS